MKKLTHLMTFASVFGASRKDLARYSAEAGDMDGKKIEKARKKNRNKGKRNEKNPPKR